MKSPVPDGGGTGPESLRAGAAGQSLTRSALAGAAGFCLVSVCVFATVALAEGWMYARLGVPGAYLAWTALFILLGGGVLGSLTVGPRGLPGFYLLFGSAFLAYAVGWVSAYFILRGAAGEWAGSLAGSVLMGSVLAAGSGVVRSAPRLWVVLFGANSAGYFLGSAMNEAVGGRAGMLLWGALYGLCLGGGLGAALHLVRRARAGAQRHPAAE